MAPGSTQFLIEMSTRNLPGGKGRPARKADNLTTIYESIVYKMWQPRLLTILLASTTCYRDSVAFLRLNGMPNENVEVKLIYHITANKNGKGKFVEW
jgi:hypothetical protein